jgi:EmrB/QacA subfamily drug resistance transporter
MTRTRTWAVALTGAALLMITLDALIVLATLPAMQRDLGVSVDRLQWVVDAYVLAYAVLTLTGAALGDRFGRRRVFAAGVVLFTLGSAAAAAATGYGALVAARAVQGTGAGVMMPLTMTLLADAFPPAERPRALGLWSSLAGVGVALGPVLGGVVVDTLDWHWIFGVNLPIGAAILVLAPRRLAESRGPQARLDLAGLALGAAGLLGLVWATSRGEIDGWTSASTLGAYGLGVLGIAAFVVREHVAAAPMLPLSLFRNRTFSIVNVATVSLYLAMFAGFTYTIQDLVHAHGATPLRAGAETLPWTIMPLLVSPFAGALGGRRGQRPLVIAGLSLLALGLVALTFGTPAGVGYPWLVLPFVTIGFGIGLTLPNIAGLALGAVAPEHIGKASGTINTFRQVGAVFGVAIGVAVFDRAGSYASAADVADGARAAFLVAAAAALVGALAMAAAPGAPLRPGRRRVRPEAELEPVPA